MNYRNAKYIDNARIDCEIDHPIYGWIPYTLDPADIDMTINNDELLQKMQLANDVEAFTPPTQAELDGIAASEIRNKRDSILASVVDPIVTNPLRWAELTPAKQQAWIDYRRSLLDITLQNGFPNNVIWPEVLV